MKRNYALFVKIDGRWVREQGEKSWPLEYARRIFQNKLLAFAFGAGPERCLKPVKE